MTFSLSTKQAFNLVKFCGEISCTWPKPRGNRFRVAVETIRWWMLFVNVLALLLSLAFAVYFFRSDITIATQAISEFGAAFEVLCNLFFCRTHAIRLQVLFCILLLKKKTNKNVLWNKYKLHIVKMLYSSL